MKYGLMEFGKWNTQAMIREECNYLASQLVIGQKIYIKGIGLLYINSLCHKNNGDMLYIYDKLVG